MGSAATSSLGVLEGARGRFLGIRDRTVYADMTRVNVDGWHMVPRVLQATVDTIEEVVGESNMSPAIIVIGKVVGLAV